MRVAQRSCSFWFALFLLQVASSLGNKPLQGRHFRVFVKEVNIFYIRLSVTPVSVDNKLREDINLYPMYLFLATYDCENEPKFKWSSHRQARLGFRFTGQPVSNARLHVIPKFCYRKFSDNLFALFAVIRFSIYLLRCQWTIHRNSAEH